MRIHAARVDLIVCGLLTTLEAADDVALDRFLRSENCQRVIGEAVHGRCTTLINFLTVQQLIKNGTE